MAGDYVSLQDRIAQEVRDSSTAAATDIEGRIQEEILSAISFYEASRFYFNQTTDTFSTVASQEYYSSSDLADIPNIVTIDSAKLTLSDGTSKDDITEVDFATLDAWQDGNRTGDPQFFALYKQQIRLGPIPTAVRTVTLAYIYKLTALSAPSDSNAWTVDAEELIRKRAAGNIWENVLKEYANADRCRIREKEALDGLYAETAMRIHGSGKLRTDEIAALDRHSRHANIQSGAGGW